MPSTCVSPWRAAITCRPSMICAADSQRALETSLFARVPLATTDDYVEYQDSGGDLWQSFVQRKTLHDLTVWVTDSKGRSLPGEFKSVFRWDLFYVPVPRQVRDPPKLEAHPLPEF